MEIKKGMNNGKKKERKKDTTMNYVYERLGLGYKTESCLVKNIRWV